MPIVPIGPVLAGRAFAGQRTSAIPCMLDAGRSLTTTSGRVAIALALEELGIAAGHNVLLPAFHCSAMSSPVKSVGATPRFYRLHDDLSIDLDDVDSRIDGDTKALMIVHYFGFPQNMTVVSEYCRSRGLALIEDCAHSFFGQQAGRPLGSFGDYSIGSQMKFFPLYDGGCLVSANRPLPQTPAVKRGFRFQAKAAVSPVERALQYRRLRYIGFLPRMVGELKKIPKGVSRGDDWVVGPGSAEGGFDFDPSWLHVRMSLVSNFLMKAVSSGRIVELRRRNFEYLLDRLSDISGCQPLYARLPSDVVPYMFPVVFDELSVFDTLKRERVPIYRWEEIPEQPCSISYRYSKCLLQFPCHQELWQHELEWLVKTIRNAVGGNK